MAEFTAVSGHKEPKSQIIIVRHYNKQKPYIGERMRKSIYILIVLMFANTAFALRCGNDLISVGDFKYKALSACGQPVSKEVIGYIDRKDSSGDRIRVMKIEEWIVKITNYGTTYYYSLVFEGNKLAEINEVSQK